MFQYICTFVLFYTGVFKYFYGTMIENSFECCAMNTRKFSMVHLAVCIPMSSLAIYKAPCVWCTNTLLHQRHYLYELSLTNSASYFIVDLYVIYFNWLKHRRFDGGKVMIFHHLSFLVTYYNVYQSRKGQHICTLFLLNEISTIFLNGIYFYSNHPKLRIVCGICLLISFFIFRILMFARLNQIIFSKWESISVLPDYLIINLLCVSLLFSTLNLFWFQKILKGFVNVLTKNI